MILSRTIGEVRRPNWGSWCPSGWERYESNWFIARNNLLGFFFSFQKTNLIGLILSPFQFASSNHRHPCISHNCYKYFPNRPGSKQTQLVHYRGSRSVRRFGPFQGCKFLLQSTLGVQLREPYAFIFPTKYL